MKKIKIEIEFGRTITDLNQVKSFCEKEDISKIITDIINAPTDIGKRITNYKGNTIATIKFTQGVN